MSPGCFTNKLLQIAGGGDGTGTAIASGILDIRHLGIDLLAVFRPERQPPERFTGLGYVFRPERPLSEYTFVYKTAGVILSRPFKYQLRNIKLP